jgi:hypothetical protein
MSYLNIAIAVKSLGKSIVKSVRQFKLVMSHIGLYTC